MLILPPGHAESLRTPRQFGVREKWFVAGALGLVVALAIGLIVSLSGSGARSSGHGCIYVTLPYVVGAQELYHCGSQAQTICSQVGTPTGFTGRAGQTVATECRKAGLKVGP